jgi:hypothetical protein
MSTDTCVEHKSVGRRPEGLRQYLQNELGEDSGGVCLEDVIRSCYREFLLQAGRGRTTAPWRLQERLRAIAGEVVRRRRAAVSQLIPS